MAVVAPACLRTLYVYVYIYTYTWDLTTTWTPKETIIWITYHMIPDNLAAPPFSILAFPTNKQTIPVYRA